MRASQELEILVAKIQAQLAPDAEVTHNARLRGQSGTLRQIDVLVRQRIGQYDMNIVLECKDYARPVDIKQVEEFQGLLGDIGAHKGALVCPKGFTKSAKERAAGLQIDLYSPIDTEPHKWQVQVEAPLLCDVREAAMSFCLAAGGALRALTLPPNFWSVGSAYSKKGDDLGPSVAAAVKKWNEGQFPNQPGEHNDLPIFDSAEVLIDNGHGSLVPVSLTVTLSVRKQLFFGYLPIEQISGFKDELSGDVITNAFTTGIFNFDEVINTWKRIDDEASVPARPMFGLIGRCAWGTDVEVPLF